MIRAASSQITPSSLRVPSPLRPSWFRAYSTMSRRLVLADPQNAALDEVISVSRSFALKSSRLLGPTHGLEIRPVVGLMRVPGGVLLFASEVTLKLSNQ